MCIRFACSAEFAYVVAEEERMEREQDVVWITTRRIKPGTYEEFRRAWRPKEFPEGMVWAYECFSEEANQVVGVSIWDSRESRERYRLSEVEAERRQAMAPYVEAESSGMYVGRELKIPKS
jgi:heme-degrading monooxygenase HmoA